MASEANWTVGSQAGIYVLWDVVIRSFDAVFANWLSLPDIRIFLLDLWILTVTCRQSTHSIRTLIGNNYPDNALRYARMKQFY